MQVDADASVLRGKLGEMLNAVLGRQAHRAELAAWFSVSLDNWQCHAEAPLGSMPLLLHSVPNRASSHPATHSIAFVVSLAAARILTVQCQARSGLQGGHSGVLHLHRRPVSTLSPTACVALPLPPVCLLQFLDFDRGCIMSHGEYMAGVQALREWSSQPQQARQYSSYGRMVADKKQHRRVEWEAQRALQEPITAAQTVRCHAGGPQGVRYRQR